MIQLLSEKHARAIITVLSDAFYEYPVMRYVLGSSGDYDRRLLRLVELFVMARVFRKEPLLGFYDGTELIAAATMSYPDASAAPPEFMTLRKTIWDELGSDAETRYNAFTAACSQCSVDIPNLHLNMLGVKRSVQKSGIGKKLIAGVHRIAREDGRSEGVTLSTENPDNVRFYEKLGYEITGHVRVAPELETWGFFRRNEF